EITGDTAASPYITAPQVARSQPPGRLGRPVHASTIIRWILNGSRGPDGQIVRLKAVRMGGRWLTTRDWLDDYAQRMTPTYGVGSPQSSSAARTRTAERAARELDRIGI